MDKLVRKIEIPLARRAIEKAGLYIVEKKDLDQLAKGSADSYLDYPLHNWLMGGKYDPVASELLMRVSLRTMTEDAVIYADSEELNGFAAWLPFGYKGTKTLPFLMKGGLRLILHSGPGIISKLEFEKRVYRQLRLVSLQSFHQKGCAGKGNRKQIDAPDAAVLRRRAHGRLP